LAKTAYDVKTIVLRKNIDEEEAMDIVEEKKTREVQKKVDILKNY